MEHMWHQDGYNIGPQNNGEAADAANPPHAANPPNPNNVEQIQTVYRLSLMQMKRHLDDTILEYQGLRANCLLLKDALVQQYVAAVAQNNTLPVLVSISAQIKTINYQITRLDQDNEPNMRHRDEVIASLRSEPVLVVEQLADVNTLLQLRQAPHFWNGRVFVTANAEEGVEALLQAQNVNFEAEPVVA